MAVVSTTRSIRYDGNGLTVAFATGFEFFENTTVNVYVAKVLQTETVDYTLTGGSGATGTVTFTVAPPSGTGNVFLERVEPRVQSTDYVPGGVFPADSADKVHDRQVHMVQELDEQLTRTIQIPNFHTATSWDPLLPDPGDTTVLPATGTYVIQLTSTGVAVVAMTTDNIANPIISKGQLLTHDGATTVALTVGADNTLLIADSGEATGQKWDTVPNVLETLTSNAHEVLGTADGTTVEALYPLLQGQCRLTKNGTNLQLSREGGRFIVLKSTNWKAFPLPATGPLLGVSGLAADTNYYIYAYDNAGTVTLEASATVPIADTDTGFMIKTGDATRTLVGFARTDSGTAWEDDTTNLHVLSYYNRREKIGTAAFTANRTTTETSWTEIDTEIRVFFLAWGDRAVVLESAGRFTAGGSNTTRMSLGTDETSTVDDNGIEIMNGGGGGLDSSAALTDIRYVTEGNRHATILGEVSAGTGTWKGNASANGTRCVLRVSVLG